MAALDYTGEARPLMKRFQPSTGGANVAQEVRTTGLRAVVVTAEGGAARVALKGTDGVVLGADFVLVPDGQSYTMVLVTDEQFFTDDDPFFVSQDSVSGWVSIQGLGI